MENILPSPIEHQERRRRLIETAPKRRAFFEQLYADKLLPFLRKYPQVDQGSLQYAITGSWVWPITGMADSTVSVNPETVEQESTEAISLNTKALLLVPHTIPHDIDTLVVNGDWRKLTDDVWDNPAKDTVYVASNIQGTPVYTVHPSYAWAHSFVFIAEHGVDTRKKQEKRQKLEASLTALLEQFTVGEMTAAVVNRVRNVHPVNQDYVRSFFTNDYSLTFCGADVAISPTLGTLYTAVQRRLTE